MQLKTLISGCLILALYACSGEIYVRDGVTDGDTFYLAERAISDNDPVLQSWVSYSLAKSSCQLQIGGRNPARESSFTCEVTARKLALDTWVEKQRLNPDLTDDYLDELLAIYHAGFLDEYVVHHFRKVDWNLPDQIDVRAYRRWQHRNTPAHIPETRIIGSWNYARNVLPK